MDWLSVLESYGVPLVMAGIFWGFIVKNNHFIQQTLMSEMDEEFKRLEAIIVQLINQQKKMQIEQKGIQTSYKVLAETIARLSGNGLREKMLRKLEKDDF